MSLSRRQLIERTATLGAGLVLAQVPVVARCRVAQASAGPAPAAAANQPGILYDLTKCAGCHFCEIACQMNKGLPPETSLISFRTAAPSSLPKNAWAVRRHQCMHCLKPACASACPVGAMEKTAAGPVVYNGERCLGCRYCMNVCPFGVPKFDWESGLLDGALIRKCDFCADRQAEGKLPACVEACPTGAVSFGQRDELLARAKDLISEQPDRYVNHVHGETEAGGTSFLMISGVPFDELGLPQPGVNPLPELSEKVMSGVLPFALVWAAALSGVTGLVRLRQRRMGKEGDHA